MLTQSRLLRPLLFLRIKSKYLGRYRFKLPILCCTLILVYFYLFADSVNLFGDASVTGQFLAFLQFLPGFYIAALAAIATFNRKLMDKPLSGDNATLIASENGNTAERTLSRRRFLSYLFGFLSFESLFLFVFCGLLQVASPSGWIQSKISSCTQYQYKEMIDWVLFFPILFLFCQMFILTLLGLFYLSDRIHWQGGETRVNSPPLF